MGAGKYRRRATIQTKQITKDDGGIAVETWTDFAVVWCDYVTAMRYKEYLAAGAVGAEDMKRFDIRYRSDIKQEMRIVYEGRAHVIESVIDTNGLHKELQLIARELATGG